MSTGAEGAAFVRWAVLGDEEKGRGWRGRGGVCGRSEGCREQSKLVAKPNSERSSGEYEVNERNERKEGTMAKLRSLPLPFGLYGAGEAS